jgi:hypothetical protein
MPVPNGGDDRCEDQQTDSPARDYETITPLLPITSPCLHDVAHNAVEAWEFSAFFFRAKE